MSTHHDDADPRPGSESASAEQRRAELLGAASADDLSPAESQELDAMCAQDPDLARERSELREFSSMLRGNPGTWTTMTPPPSLREHVIAQVNAPQALPEDTASPESDPADESAPASALAQHARASGSAPASHTPVSDSTLERPDRGRARLRQSLALAACVAIGVVGTLGVQAILDPAPAAPDAPADGLVAEEPLGPPGELGAQEPVSFSDPGAGVEVDGALVAHTWGTETVLEIDGLAPGEAFTVVLVGADGDEIESGSFLGSELPVDCRMNGAVLREDVERLEIRDDAGRAITAAALPEVD